MNLLQVYNDYRSMCGGEATVVKMIAALVEKHGGTARLLTRSSKGLDRSVLSKVRGFTSGIYSRAAREEMARAIADDRPDVVHVHNLYPLISPSVLVACRRAGVPVVMTNHNYLLTCPIVSHIHQGRICDACLGGHEYMCVLKNCRKNLGESVAYALRSAAARKLGLFRDDVAIQIVLSEFARQRLISAGFDAERIEVLPNMVDVGPESDRRELGQYVAYSGRMAAEKGIEVLLAAAARLPHVPFRLAGDGPLQAQLMADAPPNVTFVNRLAPAQMSAFYDDARFLVVPSMWFEGCPLVVSEAMSRSLPVIASRIGGLPEFIDEGVTGLLFTPGNVDELTSRIDSLWQNTAACKEMGAAGRQKAQDEYCEDVYYQRLMAIYERARQHCHRTHRASPELAAV